MLPGFVSNDYRRCVNEALRVLGIRNLVLGIHDPSFPSEAHEDTGRGSPYSEGAARFIAFARDLGFNGLQLGPQGQTSEGNPSPYDGTIFSRNVLNVVPGRLARSEEGGLLEPGWLETNGGGGQADRVDYARAHRLSRQALDLAYRTFCDRRPKALAGALATFEEQNAHWLARDALYEPLSREHLGLDWRQWGGPLGEIDQRLWSPRKGQAGACQSRRDELTARHRSELTRYAFCQYLAHRQHAQLRELTTAGGLKLFGDLQVGLSSQDTWARQSLFLPTYLMGAPPSRTNPEGQAWNYPVLDPDQYAGLPDGEGRPTRGPALWLVAARMTKMFSEFDGVRLDHPHGLVCPWVYRAQATDVLASVRGGARLFSSPDLPDHPDLARFALVPPQQLNRAAARHADDWERELSPEQVEKFSRLFDVVVDSARANGRQVSDLVCEVLSTLPYPLKRVLERHGLGRFRVTQKVNLKDPADVYRSENAAPADWIMPGNHDTKPLWAMARQWEAQGLLEAHAAYLAERLEPEPTRRAAWVARVASDRLELVQAKMAELFASPAQNVMVFFTDLMGLEETYNLPGVLSPENWTLRLTADFDVRYRARLATNAALNLPRALALAVRAKTGGRDAGLCERLTEQGRALVSGG